MVAGMIAGRIKEGAQMDNERDAEGHLSCPECSKVMCGPLTTEMPGLARIAVVTMLGLALLVSACAST